MSTMPELDQKDCECEEMITDSEFVAGSANEETLGDVDKILRALHARSNIATSEYETRLDRLIACSLDLDESDVLLLEELAGEPDARSNRTPAHFLVALTQAILELRLSPLFCASTQGEFHRSICPAAYNERSGEHHPAEMAEWRATFRAMAPEQQMIAATIVWMYRSGADSIWLRRVPSTWRAGEALRYMHDAGCLHIWLRLVARFPGW